MFTDLWRAIILGIIEGLTEFIPVSSTGHLILVGDKLAFSTGNTATFDIAIQLGAILAVVGLYLPYFQRIISPKAFMQKDMKLLILGILPALILGFLGHHTIKTYLFSPTTVAYALCVGGILMLLAQRYIQTHPPTSETLENMTLKQACTVGVFQCLSLWPGMSRSGSTIVGGMLSGLSMPVAAQFSFLLSVPMMCAAVFYDLIKTAHVLTSNDWILIAVGFTVAWGVAAVSIVFFMKMLPRVGLVPFAIYRILLGLFILAMGTACSSKQPLFHGYIDSNPSYLSVPYGGRLKTLHVHRGSQVMQNAELAQLDTELEQLALDEAQARVEQTTAQARDLKQGKRKDEMAALYAAHDAAQAAATQSQAEYMRQKKLYEDGFIALAALDIQRTKRDADAAKASELAAQVRVGLLSAREQSQRAAAASVNMAEAQKNQRAYMLQQKTLIAPHVGAVEDIFFEIGEWVPAGVPILSLQNHFTVKFYIPESERSLCKPDAQVTILCDTCTQTAQARILFCASSPEFTPPVIYSKENRSRLVFLVEATLNDPKTFYPGQPVDVQWNPTK